MTAAPSFSLIIRGGLIYDGSGGEPIRADVGVIDGQIGAIGDLSDRRAAEEIDAAGCIVTPGFVDIHTHYDGQAIWSSSLTPSSMHGVTTVVTGNCGVGFAPCRPGDRDLLVSVMEGVEDIPEVVMATGLPWNWETFPEFLDALEARPHDIDIAAYIPHSALRVFVMGQRGAAREPATADDLVEMARLVREALDHGALGFATGSVPVHRTSTGDFIPTYGAAESELQTIAHAIRENGAGIMQVLVDITSGPVAPAIESLERLASITGQLVTFSLAQVDPYPEAWREVLTMLTDANAKDGIKIKGQVFPRPVGVLLGHDLTLNPFRLCPSYEAITDLPLDRKLVELRKPELRERLLTELPADPTQPLSLMARNFERMFECERSPNYEPALETSIANRAARAGVSPETFAYDLLLKDEGSTLLYVAIANYADGSLNATLEMLQHPDCLLGLGDGGAHYGVICDASYPTFMLTHWVRNRPGTRLPLPEVVRDLSARPADAIGLHDRGRVEVGFKADLNVIDMEQLALHRPFVTRDLPSGGRRLTQDATGYRATIVNGRVIFRDGEATGALPGLLVRGSQPAPLL